MTKQTNTTTANRVSYVLAGKRENQATAKATAAAKATADKATQNRLMAAAAFAANAGDAAAAKHAAKTSTAAAKLATAANDGTATAAAKELALNALTVGGAYAYMDATAAEWVAMRDDVTAAEFVRHTTAKAASFRLVVTRKDGHKVYLTVNTTASMDWRKIDAAYERRIANQAKKAAAKGGKRRTKKAAK